MLDSLAHGAEFAEIVRGYVERATAPLLTRIAELERREVVDMAAFKAQVMDEANATAELAAKSAVAALPAAQDGKDGIDAPEVTPEQIDASVARYFEVNPVRDGEPGKDGAPGEKGDPGKDGADGVGLASALIDKDGHLIITTTRGAVLEIGQVVGRDGQPGERGEPGRDGLTLSDFDTELSEDGRILTLSLDDGVTRVTHQLQLPTMIYRGVFKDGQTYVQGDTVTWGGSLWHCDAETAEKPGDGSAWTLAAKRGSHGKDAGR